MEKWFHCTQSRLDEMQVLIDGHTHALYKVKKATGALFACFEINEHHLGVHTKGIAFGCT